MQHWIVCNCWRKSASRGTVPEMLGVSGLSKHISYATTEDRPVVIPAICLRESEVAQSMLAAGA